MPYAWPGTYAQIFCNAFRFLVYPIDTTTAGQPEKETKNSRPKWTFTADSIRLLKMDLTLTSMSTLDSDVLVG